MTTSFKYRSHVTRRDRWIVSYADLMTLLFAVFVVLFTAAQKRPIPVGPTRRPQSSSAVAPGSTQTVTDQPGFPSTEQTDPLYDRLNNVLAPAARTRNISLQRLPEGIVIRLNEAGSFAKADARPLRAVGQLLHQIALITGPTGAHIRVEGYTDDQPIHTSQFRSNWELSTARAQAVLSLLLAEPGVNPANLSVAGYGPYHPIANNDIEAGRRMNRRIDLVVTPSMGN